MKDVGDIGNPWYSLVISFIFLLIGGIWFVYLESLLKILFTEGKFIQIFNAYKSLIFIFCASIFIFLVLRHAGKVIRSRENTILTLQNHYKSENNSGIFFRKLFDNLKEAVFIIEPFTRRILDCNAYAGTIFGFERKELIGSYTRVLHVNERNFEEFGRISEKKLEDTGIFNTQYQMKKKHGELLETDHTVTYVYDESGKIERVVSIVRDITKQEKDKKAIEIAQKEREDILESMTDGFYAVDENWMVTYWNNAAEKILSKPKEAIIGKNLWEEYPEAVNMKVYEEYNKAMETGISRKFEDYFPKLDKWFEIAVYPGKNQLSVFFKDITERTQHLKAIETQNEKLREIAWTHSHSLRAPICRIMGLINLLKMNEYQDINYSDLLQYIYDAVDELDQITKTIVRKSEEIEKF